MKKTILIFLFMMAAIIVSAQTIKRINGTSLTSESLQRHMQDLIKKAQVTTFCGFSENAVKIQIWVAVCAYLLLANVKK